MDAKGSFKNSKESMALSKCTFLDPRFKHLRFFNMNPVKNEVIKNLTQTIRNKEQLSDELDIGIQQTLLLKSDLSIWSEMDNNVAIFTSLGTAKLRAIVEVQYYLDNAVVTRNQDSLKWWKYQSYLLGIVELYI